jgi:CRISPR-associated protein Csd1
MILQRLYQLAGREGLLDDTAFEEQPTPFIIKVAEDGRYLGVEERRGEVVIPSRKKASEPRRAPDRGVPLAVPRPHGNAANPGFARFFADTLPRVLPVADDEKSRRSRATFWKQGRQAAEETGEAALRAVLTFGLHAAEDDALAARIKADLERLNAAAGDRCTFAWEPDRGRTVVQRDGVRSWYRRFYEGVMGRRRRAGPTGLCQVTGAVGPMPPTHPIKLSGVPGGLATGVSLVSCDKAAFESCRLEGAANAGVGYEAADGYARAVNALIANKLKGNPRSCLRVGAALFLFWTREPADTADVTALDAPEPAQVERLLRSARAGAESCAADANAFHLLCLSGNSARAVVRDCLEAPLPAVRASLGRWFGDLTIAAAGRDGAGRPTKLFPLRRLAFAAAAAAETNRVPRDVPSRLVHAAVKGVMIPESVLAACLGRLRAEGGDGFRPARMALIKLILLRRDVPVTVTLNQEETHPAYVCGRLLCVFEQIQYAALGGVNASVTDKYFGAFSAAPATVLGRLYANSQNHLRKLRGEKPGAHAALDRLLAEVSKKLPPDPPNGRPSLRDQARFALGYYHQKAKRFEEIADRKAARAGAASDKTGM